MEKRRKGEEEKGRKGEKAVLAALDILNKGEISLIVTSR